MASMEQIILFYFCLVCFHLDFHKADDPVETKHLVILESEKTKPVSCTVPQRTILIDSVRKFVTSTTGDDSSPVDPCGLLKYLAVRCNSRKTCRLQRDPENEDESCISSKLIIRYRCTSTYRTSSLNLFGLTSVNPSWQIDLRSLRYAAVQLYTYCQNSTPF